MVLRLIPCLQLLYQHNRTCSENASFCWHTICFLEVLFDCVVVVVIGWAVSGSVCPISLKLRHCPRFGSLKLWFFNDKQEQTFSF